mmetsp:Transcript_20663/g.24832  ORF Transcript_20663/g.24832 Transcript_20663/m.24832 type:complete len:383 (+) Transcript_20663:80-1228(+)|eukprot:CAMPEP_0197850980 /NCGR_PEP_ID=MMETSP1438-20131217/16931_1 /TAXON_ID=1461541 /ORGANISM="Pterosperma sp., Strain CCMP1384" /LENGTH=382 /DNA_ID=CAMNT_0043464427 /DNA_START=78 /DNA_END=1226 /DNA_ORIENTATION=+
MTAHAFKPLSLKTSLSQRGSSISGSGRDGLTAQPIAVNISRSSAQTTTRAVISHRSRKPASVLFSSPCGRAFGGCNCAAHSTRPTRSVGMAASSAAASDSTSRPLSKLRLIQHKSEAFWFYRFLSIVYDHIVNPGHWTEDMREAALKPAKLDSPDLKVYDVGGGTGFTTLGIVKSIKPENVTLIDQSPHQIAKAKKKSELKDVEKLEGDAEQLPFETDSADRYVSAGSIEYWPEPQRGICEAYRVIKPGATACIIGPVHPTNWFSAMMADLWMLFPTEQEYIDWFTKAGFTDVKITRIGPKWYRGVRRHGLIMGCSVTGTKPVAGESPLDLGKPSEDLKVAKSNPITFLLKFILGTLAGFYYTLVPIYMWIKDAIFPKSWAI